MPCDNGFPGIITESVVFLLHDELLLNHLVDETSDLLTPGLDPLVMTVC